MVLAASPILLVCWSLQGTGDWQLAGATHVAGLIYLSSNPGLLLKFVLKPVNCVNLSARHST